MKKLSYPLIACAALMMSQARANPPKDWENYFSNPPHMLVYSSRDPEGEKYEKFNTTGNPEQVVKFLKSQRTSSSVDVSPEYDFLKGIERAHKRIKEKEVLESMQWLAKQCSSIFPDFKARPMVVIQDFPASVSINFDAGSDPKKTDPASVPPELSCSSVSEIKRMYVSAKSACYFTSTRIFHEQT